MYLSKQPDGTPVVYVSYAQWMALQTDAEFSALVADAFALAGTEIGESLRVEFESEEMAIEAALS